MWSHPQLPLMMQVASVPLDFIVSTQVPLISCSTCSEKLAVFEKAATVIVIVDFTRIQGYKELREGAHLSKCPRPTFV